MACAVGALWVTLLPALPDAAAARKKPAARKADTAPVALFAYDDSGVSTAVENTALPNGGVLWGVHRPGTHGTVALVVRAGARQEDIGRGGTALATARWVLDSYLKDNVAPSTDVRLEMHQGGAAFVMQGPLDGLRADLPRLLRAAVRPVTALRAASRERATLDARRVDTRRALPDLVAAMCWAGTSLELPTYGPPDMDHNADDEFQVLFHRTWYQPRNMTLVAVGPGGARPYAAALGALSREKKAREVVAPGEPGLPMHQVAGAPFTMTMAGAALPGPQLLAAAFIARGRTQEVLDQALTEGRLSAPFVVDVLWTKKSSVVFAVATHPRGRDPDERGQAEDLRVLEGAITAAADLGPDELHAARKREGARLSRAFSTADGAVALLVPLACVVDTPPDLRRDVMGAPAEAVRAALARLRDDATHLSLRRNPRKDR